MADPAKSSAAVGIAATFTVEPLVSPLRFILREAGAELDVACAPYNQVFQQLLSPTSLLTTNAGGVNVIIVRMEDFVRECNDAGAARELLSRTSRELSAALIEFDRRSRSPSILVIPAHSPSLPHALHADLDGAARSVLDHARTLKSLHVIVPTEIAGLPPQRQYDGLRDELAHIPFTDEYFGALALALGRKIHALLTPAQKVLVLDCDNTLWRGVVGEDGVDGIEMTDAFLRLQGFAVEQQSNGVLVCLASKNAEQDVLSVLESRSDMQLRGEHIVSHRINWKPKSENLVSLARELNLGLDSFVFIDDNPVECAQMSAALPQVVTLQLPPEDRIEAFLSNLWVFDKIAVTAEDARRTSLYRENAARQSHEDSATDIGEFIASLELEIDIGIPHESEWPRVAQLTQRTNQFNFTTLRRTESEMRAVAAEGSRVLRVNVKDRFGDYGLVGLIVAKPRGSALTVDTFLLSCRVLGRGVEHAMIRKLGELAAADQLAQVSLLCVPTPKNEPARAFADSVAAEFKSPQDAGIVYEIPVSSAIATMHRPGFDPEAVIEARKSELKKAKGSESAVPAQANRSARYTSLAQHLVSGESILAAMRAKGTRVRPLPTPPQRATGEIEERLLALWRELLNLDEIGTEDDYFALGGTSLLAVQLFAEIEQRFGVRLRLTTILESPTIRTLAVHLEPKTDRKKFEQSGNLVLLKEGGPRNLFLIHDGDGETLLYRNLARRMPEGLAVLGIEPRRHHKVPLAHVRIEDMARFYTEEVRKLQPKGPYLLGGLCAGGVIAYEMACQLMQAGERVPVLALLDAARPHARVRSGRLTSQRVEGFRQLLADAGRGRRSTLSRAVVLARGVARKLVNFVSWQLSSRAHEMHTRIRFFALRRVLERGATWPPALRELTVREIYDSAESRYVPKPLSGAGVLLARALSGIEGDPADTPFREIFADDTLGWRAIAPDMRVIDVKGGHSSMLQEPHVESVASVLVRLMNRLELQSERSRIASDFSRESMAAQ